MLNFILLMSLTNCIGGRFSDVIGVQTGIGRLIFRCILPGIAASALAYDQGYPLALVVYAWATITLGSALWFAPGWSFDEINGQYDPNKYPALVRRIGLYFVPLGGDSAANRKRGVIMKGMRGLYDLPTFILLAAVNPYAPLIGLLTGCMGLVYWACGRITPSYAVPLAEVVWGAVRGALIYAAIA